jgi:protein TonB
MVAVTQQRTQSSGLRLTVLTVAQVEEDNAPSTALENVPTASLTPAQPKKSTQTFPDVVYPASIALNLGQSMQLRVEVTPEGQAGQIEVRQGSTVKDLDNLVQDLIREILFDPATQDGKPVSSRVDMSLRLDPL